jgi:hypothetical protein
VSRLEIGLDAWDAEEIRPFWIAVLGCGSTRGSPTTWSIPAESRESVVPALHTAR